MKDKPKAQKYKLAVCCIPVTAGKYYNDQQNRNYYAEETCHWCVSDCHNVVEHFKMNVTYVTSL